MTEAASADQRLEHLYAVSRAFLRFSSVEHVLQETFEIVSRSLPIASIVTIEQGSDGVRETAVPAPTTASALGHARAASAYLTAADLRWLRSPDAPPFIVVPLVVPGGEIFGVIQFEGTRSLTAVDVEFLNAIGNQLAVALDRDRASRRAQAEIASRLELARTIAASLGEGTIAVDRDERITFINPAGAALLGTDEAQAVGALFSDFARFQTPEGARIGSPLRAAIADASTTRSEDHVLARADGARFEISYTASPIHLRGRLQGAVLAFDDIRERKRAERDRRFLLEATAELGSSLDTSTILGDLARSATRLAEACFVDVLTTDEHVIRGGWAHASPGAHAALVEHYRNAPSVSAGHHPALDVIQSGEVTVAETTDAWWTAMTSSSTERQLLQRITGGSALIVPLLSSSRRLGAMTLISRTPFSTADIALAEKLASRGAVAIEHARLYGQARDAIGLRDQMLAIVSHDLRSPLSIVMMAAGTLEECLPQGPATNAVLKIQRAAQRMERMIRDLLDYASIDAGKLSISCRAQDVESIIAEALAGFEASARARNIELDIVVPSDLPPASCDRDRVLQVIANLVGNAVKIVPAGGLIAVRAERRDHEIMISVVDTGPGISELDQNWLFERYWRGAHHQYQGTGLGLAIARGIVDAHGGTIWVESKLGHGATFHFTLPVATAKRVDSKAQAEA